MPSDYPNDDQDAGTYGSFDLVIIGEVVYEPEKAPF